jgi:hypothetical protein
MSFPVRATGITGLTGMHGVGSAPAGMLRRGGPPGGHGFAGVLRSEPHGSAHPRPTRPNATVDARLTPPRAASGSPDDPIHPLHPTSRHAAQLAPPAIVSQAAPPPSDLRAPAQPSAEARLPASLEDLLPALIRKVAWSGDARRGTIRLELGAGALSGATLLVRADDGRVHVRLDAPSGLDLDGWQARIVARLAARGLEVDGVEIG